MPDRLTFTLSIALAWFVSIVPVRAGEGLTFEKDVRPIFKAYCLDCHGGNEAPKGSLDLRLKRFAERGGDSGPAVLAGRPEESLLIERLKHSGGAEGFPMTDPLLQLKTELIARESI